MASSLLQRKSFVERRVILREIRGERIKEGEESCRFFRSVDNLAIILEGVAISPSTFRLGLIYFSLFARFHLASTYMPFLAGFSLDFFSSQASTRGSSLSSNFYDCSARNEQRSRAFERVVEILSARVRRRDFWGDLARGKERER